MALGAFSLAFLFVAAIATSFINAVAAVGGGMVLFAIMISMMNYALVIPVHGAIQLWSSATRVLVFRQHINYRLLGLFLLSYAPSATVGILFWKFLIEQEHIQPYLKIALGGYLLMFICDWSIKIKTNDRKKLMLYAGGWSGIFAMTVGSPAPVMAPCFIKANLYKEEFIGSWALGGMIVHASKLPLFYIIWDSVMIDHLWLILLMGAGVIMGVNLGKACLSYVSETLFRKILTIMMIVIAMKLIVWDGLRDIIFT